MEIMIATVTYNSIVLSNKDIDLVSTDIAKYGMK